VTTAPSTATSSSTALAAWTTALVTSSLTNSAATSRISWLCAPGSAEAITRRARRAAEASGGREIGLDTIAQPWAARKSQRGAAMINQPDIARRRHRPPGM
jgi:hypothetical protein